MGAERRESGWGINFAHQGTQLFATWYTYDTNGKPMWLSLLGTQGGSGSSYTGPLLKTSGPRYDAYDKTAANAPLQVGTGKVTFTNGNTATMGYIINGGGLPSVTQTKTLTRFLFGPGAATICH